MNRRASRLWAIGVDVGGTKIEAALVEAKGSPGHRLRQETDSYRGPMAVKKTILSMIKELQKNAGARPIAVGVGMAGQIDPRNGSVRFAPNLGWRDEPFQEDLARELGIPVLVTNDVRAATFGEWKHGAGRGCEDLICLFVGTGIGGGVVSGGRLLTGCSNTAGEFGHIVIEQNGRLCPCGNRGCLEALAAGRAIAEQAREEARMDPEAGEFLLQEAGGKPEGITAQVVVRGCRAGNAIACRIIDQVAKALSAGVASLVNVFNPCRCLLGGGVIDGIPELVGRVEAGVRQRALPPATKSLEILPAQLGKEAGVVGAASLAMNSIK